MDTIQSMTVKRPLLRYFGGKFQMRNWIISHFPKHEFYAEPFCGAASILLAKEPAPKGEIINDLNDDVINLFRIMQHPKLSKELERRIEWTPYSVKELIVARQGTNDPVERARRIIVRSFFAIETAGVKGSASGFRMKGVSLGRLDKSGKRTFRNCARDWGNWKEALPTIKNRLSKVMIYSTDAIEFIQQMSTPECLLYIDPPYHHEKRSKPGGGTRYVHEFSAEQHCRLIDALLESSAMIVLSGYEHESYLPLKKAGYKLVQRDYRANMSTVRRTECLWISPNAVNKNLQSRN